jgi:hypothetical protein
MEVMMMIMAAKVGQLPSNYLIMLFLLQLDWHHQDLISGDRFLQHHH